jgi:hypothetical protein
VKIIALKYCKLFMIEPANIDPGQKRNATNTAELIIVLVRDAIAAVPVSLLVSRRVMNPTR